MTNPIEDVQTKLKAAMAILEEAKSLHRQLPAAFSKQIDLLGKQHQKAQRAIINMQIELAKLDVRK